MARVKLWPVALLAVIAAVLAGCSDREVNPYDPRQDPDPPIVTSFGFQGGVASWTTDEPALCVVEYGPARGDYLHYAYESTKAYSGTHRATLLGMEDGEEYRVRVRSLDRAGNEGNDASVALPTTINGVAFGGVVMTLSMIDVGHGLAMVLTTPDGSNVLIDAARLERLDQVVTFLDEHAISYFDAAVATHYDSDHWGGFGTYDPGNPPDDPPEEVDGVLNRYWFGAFVAPDTRYLYGGMPDLLENKIERYDIEIVHVEEGDTSFNTDALDWDDTAGFEVEVLSAGVGGLIYDPDEEGDEGAMSNNNSVVLRIRFGGVTFVTTGDAEFFAEYRMIDRYGGSALRADVLQVGHHGNDDASSEIWLDNVSPRIGLISNAMIDAALEKEVVLQGLRAVDADYFVTDHVCPNTPRDADPTYGNLIVVTDGETIEVIVEEHELQW